MAEFTCFKCHGAGFIDKWAHINGGTCFSCGGKGYRSLSGKAAEAYAAKSKAARPAAKVFSAAEARKQGVKAPDPQFGRASSKPMVRSESGKFEAPWGLGEPSAAKSSTSTSSSKTTKREPGDLSDFFDSMR